jgi:hypothetical protein
MTLQAEPIPTTGTTADRDVDWSILPPVGQATDPKWWGKVSQLCNGLFLETQAEFAEGHRQADSNRTIYRYGDDPKPTKKKVTSNQIRDDCLMSVNQLLREPPDITVAPVETGAPPIQIPLGTPQMDPTTGQPVLDPMTGMPVEAMFQLDDQVRAEFWQRQFDFYWERGRLGRAIAGVVLNGAIDGWALSVFEWDAQNHRPRLYHTISIRQIGIDPNVGCIDAVDEANYSWVRWYVDRWKARAAYPELADAIEDRAREGAPRTDGRTELGGNVSRNYYRKMVDLKHIFLRNQPVRAMSPKEAIGAGLIEQQSAAAPNLGDATGPAAEGDLAGQAAAVPSGDQEASGGGIPDPQGVPPDVPAPVDPTGLGGDVLPSQLGAGPVAVLAAPKYVLTGTDTEVTPQSPAWPYWLGLRHLLTIDDQIVAIDEVWNGWDMPIVHFVAIPQPMTPMGIGMPEGMAPMQRGANRMLTNLVDYSDYLPHPASIMSTEMANELKKKGITDLHSKPDRVYVVPGAAIVAANGQPFIPISPPPLNEALPEIHAIIKAEMNDRANSPQVASGKQPGDVTGWQAIQQLQAAAASRYDLEGQWVADMVWRTGMLLLHELQYRLTVQELCQVCSEYPPQIVQILKLDAQQNEFNLEVEVHSAVGGVQSRKRAEAIQKRQLNVISQQTLTDRLGENYFEEHKKLAEENAEMMQQQAAQAAMMPAGPEPSGGKPASGNGQHAGNNGNGRM